MGVDIRNSQSNFMHIRFTDTNHACIEQPIHNVSVLFGNIFSIESTAHSSAYSLGLKQVLDSQRRPAQCSRHFPSLHAHFCLSDRILGAEGNVTIELRIERLDTRQLSLH